MKRKTNFDRYIEKKLKDASFAERFKKAGEAWDVAPELADDRHAAKAFIEKDPLLHRFFTVFLFEELPAGERCADTVLSKAGGQGFSG